MLVLLGFGIDSSCLLRRDVSAAQARFDTYSAERARKSNDAQVIAMGAQVNGPELARSIVRCRAAWCVA